MHLASKGANSTKNHVPILDLDLARAQLPDEFYTENEAVVSEQILMRIVGAGASRAFLHHLDVLELQFSTSYALAVINEQFNGRIIEKKY